MYPPPHMACLHLQVVHTCMYHVSSSAHGMPPYTSRTYMHVSSSSHGMPPYTSRTYMHVSSSSYGILPYTSRTYMHVSSSSHGLPPGPQAGGAGAPSSIYVSCVACGCRLQMPAHAPTVACPRCTMVTQAADPRAKASFSYDVPSSSKSRKYMHVSSSSVV
jgi:predicted RNA-binding Zn-ribbon protein involved in translation (DUF1610 family)